MIRAVHAESHRSGCSPRAFLEFSHECDLISASRPYCSGGRRLRAAAYAALHNALPSAASVLDAGFPGIPSLHWEM